MFLTHPISIPALHTIPNTLVYDRTDTANGALTT